jgi:hypothetical protein
LAGKFVTDEYPLDFEKHFAIRQSGTPEHYKTVRAEILAKAPYAHDLTPNELNALATAVYWIDYAASAASQEIKRSRWNREKLRSLVSPTRSKRHLPEWAHLRDRQTCIEECKLARAAVFQGDWGVAVESALSAGQLSSGSMRVNRRRTISNRAPHPTTIRAQKNKTIILGEAARIRARRKSSPNEIAGRIADQHSGERGFSYETVRKVLSKDASWENQI